MPLEHSASKSAISDNIRTEKAAGKPQAQAVAIAMHTADEASKDGRASHKKFSEMQHRGDNPLSSMKQGELADKYRKETEAKYGKAAKEAEGSHSKRTEGSDEFRKKYAGREAAAQTSGQRNLIGQLNAGQRSVASLGGVKSLEQQGHLNKPQLPQAPKQYSDDPKAAAPEQKPKWVPGQSWQLPPPRKQQSVLLPNKVKNASDPTGTMDEKFHRCPECGRSVMPERDGKKCPQCGCSLEASGVKKLAADPKEAATVPNRPDPTPRMPSQGGERPNLARRQDESWHQGSMHFLVGGDCADCKHAPGSMEHESWNKGYNETAAKHSGKAPAMAFSERDGWRGNSPYRPIPID